MSIIYIEEKLKKKTRDKQIIKALSDIGLKPEEISDIVDQPLSEDTLIEYQEWVKERFFQEYELNNEKIISPKFGEKNNDNRS